MSKIKIGTDYEIIYKSKPFAFKALRHGEEWRNLVGDNLILQMLFMIEDLQEENQKLKDRLQISPQGNDKIDELEEMIRVGKEFKEQLRLSDEEIYGYLKR